MRIISWTLVISATWHNLVFKAHFCEKFKNIPANSIQNSQCGLFRNSMSSMVQNICDTFFLVKIFRILLSGSGGEHRGARGDARAQPHPHPLPRPQPHQKTVRIPSTSRRVFLVGLEVAAMLYIEQDVAGWWHHLTISLLGLSDIFPSIQITVVVMVRVPQFVLLH